MKFDKQYKSSSGTEFVTKIHVNSREHVFILITIKGIIGFANGY